MHLDIWECGKHHVHLNCDGFAVQFQDFDEFIRAITACQQYIEHKLTMHYPVPDIFADAFRQYERD